MCWSGEWTADAAGEGPLRAGGGRGSGGDVVANSKGRVNRQYRGGGGHLEGGKRGVVAVGWRTGRGGGGGGRAANRTTCFFSNSSQKQMDGTSDGKVTAKQMNGSTGCRSDHRRHTTQQQHRIFASSHA
jgi:hypothetical protein